MDKRQIAEKTGKCDDLERCGLTATAMLSAIVALLGESTEERRKVFEDTTLCVLAIQYCRMDEALGRKLPPIPTWTPVNRGNGAMRWLLMLDNNGIHGIRLGRPEESGWRLVDEFGKSTWQPHHDRFYIAEMPLSVPTDAPLPTPAETPKEQN